jgi:hypothetical protein
MAAAVAQPASIASSQRVEPGSVDIPVIDFQRIKNVKPHEVEKATEEWVESFNKIIQSGSFADLKDLFLENSYWRDHYCLSWNASTCFMVAHWQHLTKS